MNNSERAWATYNAIKKKRAAKAKRIAVQADNTTAELIKHKCRGRYIKNICNSTARCGR